MLTNQYRLGAGGIIQENSSIHNLFLSKKNIADSKAYFSIDINWTEVHATTLGNERNDSSPQFGVKAQHDQFPWVDDKHDLGLWSRLLQS